MRSMAGGIIRPTYSCARASTCFKWNTPNFCRCSGLRGTPVLCDTVHNICSRSSKVTDFSTNQKRVGLCDLLLVEVSIVPEISVAKQLGSPSSVRFIWHFTSLYRPILWCTVMWSISWQLHRDGSWTGALR